MDRYLLDTNILLRVLQPESGQRSVAVRAISCLAERGDLPCITPQVLIEFWAVATRPVEVNGFGWTAEQAAAQLRDILQQFPVLEDGPTVFAHWVDLVSSYGIVGKRVHDARLVAVMRAHGIDSILTFDTDDFSTFREVAAVHPDSVQ
jgi:predicted nucleic acid-binding protein